MKLMTLIKVPSCTSGEAKAPTVSASEASMVTSVPRDTAMMTAPTTRMRVIRRFTTHVFNTIARRFAGWLPGFGILEYKGRKSGRTYRTPINVFRRGEGFVFALTYGADVQWVKNIVVAGGCILRTRGRAVRLVDPELFVDSNRRLMPLLVRIVLRFDRATEFLRMRIG
jgi:deazaflavin-dependent oxidoreductase (nitroreductase family)